MEIAFIKPCGILFMEYPHYSYPRGLMAAVARDVILLRRRDFHQDARSCIEKLIPPLSVSGPRNIPRHGRCVITVNHYHRPGFGAEWLPLAISALASVHVHWIMTAEFMYQGKWYRTIGSLISRMLLRRIACIYNFTTMPPMPPRPHELKARASAVHAVVAYVRQTQNPVIGFAPEGYDTPNGVLARPATGVGRFGLLLARSGLKFVPVGAYEANGVLHLHFGAGYTLTVESGLTVDEKDRGAAETMMKHIACLLPSRLRGEFA
jgi:hypothetical protein